MGFWDWLPWNRDEADARARSENQAARDDAIRRRMGRYATDLPPDQGRRSSQEYQRGRRGSINAERNSPWEIPTEPTAPLPKWNDPRAGIIPPLPGQDVDWDTGEFFAPTGMSARTGSSMGGGGAGGQISAGASGTPVRYQGADNQPPVENDPVGDFFRGLIDGLSVSSGAGLALRAIENMGAQDPWMPDTPERKGPQGRAGSGYARGPQSGNKPRTATAPETAGAPQPEPTLPGSPAVPAEGTPVPAPTPTGLDPALFDLDSFQTHDPYTYSLNQRQAEVFGEPKREVGGVSTVRFTPEAWATLPQEQKDAAMLNQLLLDARNQDLAADQPYNFARRDYDTGVADMFGQDNGSQRDLINIVNLLDSIGFQGGDVVDLDEFASLERAFTWDEMQNLNDWGGDFSLEVQEKVTPGDNSNRARGQRTPGMSGAEAEDVVTSNYGELRGSENMRAIDFDMVEKAGAFILDSMGANPNAWNWNVAARNQMGLGMPNERPLGYASNIEDVPEGVQRQLEDAFQGAWLFLKNPETTVDVLLQGIEEAPELADEATRSALWDYIAQRLAYEDQSGGTAGRSAEEIRQMLGWEG